MPSKIYSRLPYYFGVPDSVSNIPDEFVLVESVNDFLKLWRERDSTFWYVLCRPVAYDNPKAVRVTSLVRAQIATHEDVQRTGGNLRFGQWYSDDRETINLE